MQRQEVDKLILLQLKQIGLQLPAAGIKEISPEDFYRATTLCLQKIYEQNERQPEDYPSELPEDTAGRFRIVSTLTDSITELGYKNSEFNFDVFLYPNENTMRSLLGFLVEQVQGGKDVSQTSEASKGDDTAITLKERIQNSLTGLVKSTHVKKLDSKISKIGKKVRNDTFVETNSLFTLSDAGTPFEERYVKRHAPFLVHQVSNVKNLPISVFEDNLVGVSEKYQEDFEWESRGIDTGLSKESFIKKKRQDIMRVVADVLRAAKSSSDTGISATSSTDDLLFKKSSSNADSTFSRRVNFETEAADESVSKSVGAAKTENPEEEEKRRTEEVEKLQGTLDKINDAMEALRKSMDTLNGNSLQTEEAIQNEKTRKKGVEEKFKLTKTTYNLLQDKEKNIKEMEQISGAAAQHIIDLAAEWETHRKPLLEKYRMLKQSISEKKNNYRKQLEVAKQQKANMKKTIEDIRNKEQMLISMQKEYEQLPKDVERSSYVTRIMDIVRNVEKQKKEIQKALIDNRELQRELASLTEKVTRTFKDVEEDIFKEAQKDELMKQVYKYLLKIREEFEVLVSNVNEVATAQNQIRTFERQIEELGARNDLTNIERVTKDLEMVKKENMSIFMQIKKQ